MNYKYYNDKYYNDNYLRVIDDLDEYCVTNKLDLDTIKYLIDVEDYITLKSYLKYDMGKDRIVDAEIIGNELGIYIQLYECDYTYSIKDFKCYCEENGIDLDNVERLIDSKDYKTLKSYTKLPIDKDVVTDAFIYNNRFQAQIQFYEKTSNNVINKNPFVIVDDEIVSFELTDRDLDLIDYCIEVPEGVKRIGEEVFLNRPIKSIVLPSTLETIGKNAFSVCYDLRKVELKEGIKKIEECAFSACSYLKYINFPSTLISIGEYAFINCTSLKEIYIGKNVHQIKPNSFEECILDKIVVDKENKYYDSRNDCNSLIETKTNTLIKGSNNSTIPNGVTEIVSNAFKGCTFKNMEIPSSVVSIGSSAFYGCKNFKKINLPSNVKCIKYFTFGQCSNLKQVDGCEGLEEVDSHAFWDCNNLENINLPLGSKYILK